MRAKLDPIIEELKKKVDRNKLRENLKLTPDQRLRKLQEMVNDPEEIRKAMTEAQAEVVAEWEPRLKRAIAAQSQLPTRHAEPEGNS